jgi:hypothetical protein
MRVRLKGISSARKRLADGRLVVYWYSWRCGPRLEGEPDSPAFVASYNAALASRQKPSTETLNVLLDAYRDAEAFRALAPKTAMDYGRILSTIGACLEIVHSSCSTTGVRAATSCSGATTSRGHHLALQTSPLRCLPARSPGHQIAD